MLKGLNIFFDYSKLSDEDIAKLREHQNFIITVLSTCFEGAKEIILCPEVEDTLEDPLKKRLTEIMGNINNE